jgi:predicted nucleic acid-binding protein
LSGFLLDTSIISELAPGRLVADGLPEWLRANRSSIFMPVVAVIEIEKGISRLTRAGGSRRAEQLSQWLDRILETFTERVLSLDVITARRAGAMSDEARAKGRDPGLADVMIAAIADIHGLTVATRNLRHFAPLGVPHIDPLLRPRR